jgi:YHS domain-containing protein
MTSRRLQAALILSLGVIACRPEVAPRAPKQRPDVRTIDSADPRPALIEPPPVLTDEGPQIKPKSKPGAFADTPAPLTEKDEQVRAQLPFAPAIAMDPVSGGKVSIRADTPTFEYKGRVFYFSSEENRQTFRASPDQYIKGSFSKT